MIKQAIPEEIILVDSLDQPINAFMNWKCVQYLDNHDDSATSGQLATLEEAPQLKLPGWVPRACIRSMWRQATPAPPSQRPPDKLRKGVGICRAAAGGRGRAA